MSVINRSLLSRECNLINVLKALVLTVSMCSGHVIFYRRLHRDILHYLEKECQVESCLQTLLT
jgi:hypothetical protein